MKWWGLAIPLYACGGDDLDMQPAELRVSRFVTGRSSSRGLTRLLLLWQMPATSDTQAREEALALAERDRLRLIAASGIAAAELVRLERAGDLHPQQYDWMLVVDVEHGARSHQAIDDLFEDLLSANARPIMLRCAEP